MFYFEREKKYVPTNVRYDPNGCALVLISKEQNKIITKQTKKIAVVDEWIIFKVVKLIQY